MILEIRHEDGGESRTVRVGSGAVLLGKHTDCDVVLADSRVSKRHARIVSDGEGWLLEDLGSTNGTYVDGEALAEPTRMTGGQEFSIGPFRIRLDADREAATEPPTSLEATARVPISAARAADTPPPSRAGADALPPPVDFGPLAPLLDDDGVSEIMVNGPQEVFVERNGLLELSDLRFASAQAVSDLARAIAARAGLSVDPRRPMVDARLPDGSRMNAILPPLSLRGPCLTIRRFPSERLSADRLVGIEALSPPMLEFLKAGVAGKLSLLVSGGTGSGKTTLLNALCAFIGPGERVVTIEDAAELRLPQRHVLPLETRPPDADGGGEVTVRDLVRNALRMRPSRIVVGEVRGAEALDMLQAMNTGHEGSLSTIHANSPREALSRLETLVLFAGVELPIRAIREQVCGAISFLVQVDRLADARRRVTSICELSGMEGDTFTTGEIFRWEKGPDGSGRFRATGYVPRCRDRLLQRGQHVDNAWFR